MPNGNIAIAPELLHPGALMIKPVVTHDAPSGEISNPALRKIAEDIADAAKYSLTAVAAKPDLDVRAGSVEADFKTALASIRADTRQTAVKNAGDVLRANADSLKVLFGRYGALPAEAVARQGFERASEALPALKIEPKAFGFAGSAISVPVSALRATAEGLVLSRDILPPQFNEFQNVAAGAALDAATSGVLNRELFESVWGPIWTRDPFMDGSDGAEFEAQAPVDKLGVYVRMIKCEDETNPEWAGDDEIALAGVSTDEDGDTKKIAERYIGGGFSDGRSKSYSNWMYHMFSLTERTYWPKKFGVTFILAEKDHGGLSSFLNELWLKIKDKVRSALNAAAQAAGVALAAFLGLPEVGALIGRAIGEALNWIINVLVGWLIRLFGDDIFRPFTAWVNVPSVNARWHYPNGTWGNPWSPVSWFSVSGHGGRYRLDYQWNLYT